MVGLFDGAGVIVVVVLEVVVEDVDDGFEQPAVLLTSATTASLQSPLVSCDATQKKPPPLHG